MKHLSVMALAAVLTATSAGVSLPVAAPGSLKERARLPLCVRNILTRPEVFQRLDQVS
jgi:hypothetical protein